LKVWQDWALAREYDVDIEKYMSNFVMLIINTARPILAKFPTRNSDPAQKMNYFYSIYAYLDLLVSFS
jgi:hypothetical protein